MLLQAHSEEISCTGKEGQDTCNYSKPARLHHSSTSPTTLEFSSEKHKSLSQTLKGSGRNKTSGLVWTPSRACATSHIPGWTWTHYTRKRARTESMTIDPHRKWLKSQQATAWGLSATQEAIVCNRALTFLTSQTQRSCTVWCHSYTHARFIEF